MAIIFHSEKYSDIQIDAHTIIGITGYDYDIFLKSLTGNGIYYIDNEFICSNKKVSSIINNSLDDKKITEYLSDLGLTRSFLDQKINNLSHSEQKLFKYFRMLCEDTSIIIISEPFLDLDYDAKKRLISLFKKLVKKKTIIIGSLDTNVIYTQCKKVLLLGKTKYLYQDVSSLKNKNVLKQFHVSMPDILMFIRIAEEKKKKLPYSKDVRDLIKDVYRNVSK